MYLLDRQRKIIREGGMRKISFVRRKSMGKFMKRDRKILALMITVAMTMSTVGCGNSGGEEGSTENSQKTVQETTQISSEPNTESNESTEEITTVTLYPANASLESGVRDGWIREMFADHGLEVEVWAYSEDKTNAIMASGDLPDVMYVNDENLEILIDNNMIVNLGEHLDQMPKVTSLDGMDVALNYMKEFKSAGTGELYAMPTFVGKGPEDGTTERNILKLYWDYYEEIGAPAFTSMDELIPILKEIQELHPTDAAGNQVYGVGTYYDAKNMNYLFGYSTCFGYGSNYFNQMVAANMVDGELEYLLEEDGILYESLKWFNKLFKEGLFDPDSINMDRATHQSMISANGKNGTYIVSLADSPGWNPYYQGAYFEGERIFFPNYNTYGKSGVYLVINANTQNLDACLRLFDMMADPDVYLVWRNMQQGEIWDVEDGNIAYLTEAGLESVRNGTTFVSSRGEENKLFNTDPICNVGSDTSYVDRDGNVLPVLTQNWPEALAIYNDSEQARAWQETYGYDNLISLLEDKGALYRESRLADASNFVELPDDSQQLTIDTLVDTVNTAAWQMIYAESDDDFENIWSQMVSDAEELGAKEIYDWAVSNIENAIKIRDSLTGEEN